VRERKDLLVEAYSGFGKTVSVLVGALVAAEDLGLRIIYACRTKREIARVLEEVETIRRKGEVPAAVVLSKEDSCLLARAGNFCRITEVFCGRL